MHSAESLRRNRELARQTMKVAPQPKLELFEAITLPKDIVKKAERAAKRRKITIQELIIEALGNDGVK